MKKYVLEKHCCVTVLDDFCVFLKGIGSKFEKVAFVVEKDGCGCFLVISSIAGVKDLDSDFSVLI